MHIENLSWNEKTGWTGANLGSENIQLVLYFGARARIESGKRFQELKAYFPNAEIVGCSTAGNILDTEISENDVVAVAIEFITTEIHVVSADLCCAPASKSVGINLGDELRQKSSLELAGVFVLSDGIVLNGSEFIAGMVSSVGTEVSVTGGLSGDDDMFETTVVGVNGRPKTNTVVAVGFYGSAVRFGSGTAGGWDVLGPNRTITKSKGDTLFEVDNMPALDWYTHYLGDEEAAKLPGSSLYFPLKIWDPARPDHDVTRTILTVDTEAKSLKFAGDIPQGWSAKLLYGTSDKLPFAATRAARRAKPDCTTCPSGTLALLVSCIGRKLLMGQRAVDEVEAVADELGATTTRIGFYSYGEICPHSNSGECTFHNQTMTITTIYEAA